MFALGKTFLVKLMESEDLLKFLKTFGNTTRPRGSVLGARPPYWVLFFTYMGLGDDATETKMG